MNWLKRLFTPKSEPPSQQPSVPEPAPDPRPSAQSPDILDELEESRRTEHLARQAGMVRGEFYVDLVPRLNQLRKEKDDDAGLELLTEIIEASERTAAIENRPPPPGYTERASVILRRRKQYADEIALIDRYEAQRQRYAAGDPHDQGSTTWGRLEQRRTKARELAAKSG
ncbi:hypothetical protein [Brevibacterium oceani]|uniref:hypothetical protein n=1 Tax=Brevibacterium oceani TaxID=358099 RepID=UPI0015E6AE92|nr:hypothetical protein [Brevibacterium oceani]